MAVNIEKNKQIVSRDIEALYLGNLKTVEFDLRLPVKGIYGSDISWESGDERFLREDGKIFRPLYGMGNREVILTGIFVSGDVCITKDYQVTILEQENPYKDTETYHVWIEDIEQADDAQKVIECTGEKVRILPGNEYYDTQERMHRYLLGVEDDQMLYHFRSASGLDTKGADSPYGWDAKESQLRGHTTGHYLSALALCYHATGDCRIKKKAIYMVRELEECQRAFAGMEGIKEGFLSGYSEEQFDLLEAYTPYPRIWAPYYTLHKIMAGLLDCYQYIELEKALLIAERMGMWTWQRLRRLPRRQLSKMWSMYIAGEFGGMNVVMAQLARLTGREEFIECAKLFDNDKLFGPLSAHEDMLSGMHANQHIPQILGAVELYKSTKESRYLEIAKVFWTTVTRNRSYATGGVGETEMFQGFRKIGALLTANTQETCASYNMLKLSKELYQLNPDTRYMDYYERTLLNHILATPDVDDSGESTYFFSLGPGMRREFLKENSCCHGTGMESHFRYREGIYYQKEKELYINLYIPSELISTDQNRKVRIERTSRRTQEYRIWVQGEEIERLYLRRPDWAADTEIREEERDIPADTDERGYISITGDFTEGRLIDIRWKPKFQIIRTPDEPRKAAIQYGPYVLAALSDKTEFIQIAVNETNIAAKMRWAEYGDCDDLHFVCDGFEWLPVCEIGDLSYHVYVICTS